jgi:hypothetical protein
MFREAQPGDCGGGNVPRTLEMCNPGDVRLPFAKLSMLSSLPLSAL